MSNYLCGLSVSGSTAALTELQILTSQMSCGHFISVALGIEPRASCMVGKKPPVVVLNHVPNALGASCIESCMEPVPLVVVTFNANTRRQRGPVL